MNDTKENYSNDLLLAPGFQEEDIGQIKEQGEGREGNIINEQEIEGKIILSIAEMMKGEVEEKFSNDLINALYDAYEKEYRHSYYTISLTIFQNLGAEKNALEYLSNNIQRLYELAQKRAGSQRNISNGFKKLYDHIKLEITRINDYNTNINQVKELIEQFNEKSEANIQEAKGIIEKQKDSTIKMLEETTKPIMNEVNEVKNGILSQTLSILGIFSAIVLAFSGGMIYSSSVLENIDKSSAYRILLVCLIIGFVFINAIIALLMYLGRIINKDKEIKFEFKKFLSSNIFWIATDTIFVLFSMAILHGWNHSSEKALLDASRAYQIEQYRQDITETVSGNK